MKQIIEEPTRITNTCKSLIDHIICNNDENIVQSGTISVGLSDLFLTFCSKKVTRSVFNKHNTVKIRSLKHYSKEDFLHRLQCSDCSACFSSSCINQSWLG